VSALLVKSHDLERATTALDRRLSLMQVHSACVQIIFFCLHHGPKLRAAEHAKAGVYNFGRSSELSGHLMTSSDARDFLYTFIIRSLRNNIRSVGRVNRKHPFVVGSLSYLDRFSGHFAVSLRVSTSCPLVPLLSLAGLLSHISAVTPSKLLRLGLL